MNTSEMTITVLEAAQGEFMTQAALKEGEEPIFITKAFLAQGSTADEWRTATAAEKEECERQQQEKIKYENNL